MRHGVLPRTLHIDRPSTHVDWSAGAVELLTAARPWPGTPDRPRRAGVSSFGVSGTNAHLILEQAPDEEAAATTDRGADGVVPWVVSARSAAALRAQARNLREFAAGQPDLEVGDVGWSLVSSRSRFEHRAVVLGRDRQELLDGLASVSDGAESASVVRGVAEEPGGVVFLFPGQGAPWAGVARQLCDVFPAFAQSLDEICERFDAHLPYALKPLLLAPAEQPVGRTDITQPALFAIQISLCRLMQRFCPQPSHLIGHSVGEIAAAHVSGALDLDGAVRLVAARGQAMQAVGERGAMLAVRAHEDEVSALLRQYEGVGIAAVNGPDSVVVSGRRDVVLDLREKFVADGTSAKLLGVDQAFHSPLMDPVLADFAGSIDELPAGRLSIPLVSTSLGREATLEELTSVAHWVHHVRAPVRFFDAVRHARAAGANIFLEVGPGATLASITKEALAGDGVPEALVLSSSRRDRGAVDAVVGALAHLHVRGVEVDWGALFGPRQRVDLPTYAFQRQRYWLDFQAGPGGGGLGSAGLSATEHPLVSAVVEHPGTGEIVFTGVWSQRTHGWLADHVVLGAVVVPATVYLDLALWAGEFADCAVIEELSLEVPLVLPRDGGMQVRIVVGAADEAGRSCLTMYSRPHGDGQGRWTRGGWTRHATGSLSSSAPQRTDDVRSLAVWPPAGATRLDLDGLHDAFATAGYDYGPAFRGLREVWRRGDDLYASATLPVTADGPAGGGFVLHPALFDAALHAMVAGGVLEVGDGQVWLPFSWSGVTLTGACGPGLRVRISPAGDGVVAVTAADEQGREIAHVGALTLRPANALPHSVRGGQERSLFALEWRPVQPGERETHRGRWCVLGAKNGLAGRVAAAGDQSVVLIESLDDVPGECPRHIVLCLDDLYLADIELTAAVGDATTRVLACVQRFLAEEQLAGAALVVLTRLALDTGGGEKVESLPGASVWGLVRSARTEHPGRFRLVDIDDDEASLTRLPDALAVDEDQLAVRGGAYLVPRMTRAAPPSGQLPPPPAGAHRLGLRSQGTLENLAWTPCPEVEAPLSGGQVRIAVHAAGLNFRDVTIALGLVAGTALGAGLGGEGAGTVLEVAGDVKNLSPGDRVMGIFPGAFGRVAVADHRMILPIPGAWSYAEAASVPAAFLTAYYALHHVRHLARGQRILIHAAAGGVGLAAVALAKHAGAEIYATASPAKWQTLRDLGLDDDHLASSRDLDFAGKFLETSGGRGVDVVLNSLAHAFVDASLTLLPEGGSFIEMGKTDIRDPRRIAADHPGVDYRAFDLYEAGPDLINEMFRAVMALFAGGRVHLNPISVRHIRDVRHAFREMSRGRHTGKLVLEVGDGFGGGTVLVTGGTGGVGSQVARHLVAEHGVRSLVLASRRGMAADGAAELVSDLEKAGAAVKVTACDVADPAAVAAVLADMPGGYPLTAIVHAAGVLADGTVASLTTESVERVLRPKVGGAVNLHELTRDRTLSAFIQFSAFAGTLGTPGQANYAAANGFLDGLAAQRRASGRAGTSLCWGWWHQDGGMTGDLAQASRSRIRRLGIAPMAAPEALALFDAACAIGAPVLIPARLDVSALRNSTGGELPHLLRDLTGSGGPRRNGASKSRDGGLSARLAALPAEEAGAAVVDWVRDHVATVLGHPAGAVVEADLSFTHLGLDSLTSVELCGRLGSSTGLRLPSTVVFNYPTPRELGEHIFSLLRPAPGARDAGIPEAPRAHTDELADLDLDALVDLALNERGS
ncbi:type I polyketide synthase [Saccharomonospora sp. NPDC046836]|uniref:type I polyketide synthase n=1 Tax=Saccharomonospora sp. NPDC046836 TaxID=3156921 RepID=UPI0033DF208B